MQCMYLNVHIYVYSYCTNLSHGGRGYTDFVSLYTEQFTLILHAGLKDTSPDSDYAMNISYLYHMISSFYTDLELQYLPVAIALLPNKHALWINGRCPRCLVFKIIQSLFQQIRIYSSIMQYGNWNFTRSAAESSVIYERRVR